MDLAHRIELAPAGVPLAAIGAALLGVAEPDVLVVDRS